MSLLNWKPDYSLGIPSVDFEHRQMIDMINRIYDHIEASAEAATIEAGLEDIYAGISAHFALEERHMRELGYAEYEAHKENHEELLDEIRELMDDFADSPEQGRARLRKSLADWFGVHFATFDARLHDRSGSVG
ncbi:MAG: hemerythrin family protein [Desulfuromonadales bacterium]|nr:hemerythrin family protein [Desulfuromonadales bacterium]